MLGQALNGLGAGGQSLDGEANEGNLKEGAACRAWVSLQTGHTEQCTRSQKNLLAADATNA